MDSTMLRLAEIEKREMELGEQLSLIINEQKSLSAEKALIQYQLKQKSQAMAKAQDMANMLIEQGVSVEDAIKIIEGLAGKSTFAGRKGYEY